MYFYYMYIGMVHIHEQCLVNYKSNLNVEPQVRLIEPQVRLIDAVNVTREKISFIA